jgi:hypothetical protein
MEQWYIYTNMDVHLAEGNMISRSVTLMYMCVDLDLLLKRQIVLGSSDLII